MTTRRRSFGTLSKKDWESLAIKGQFLTLKIFALRLKGFNLLNLNFEHMRLVILLKAYPLQGMLASNLKELL
jgi:hypothetical protein